MILSIILFFVVGIILKPIDIIVKLIDRTAALDFTHYDPSDAVVIRRDETGKITRSIGNMRKSIRTIVYQLDETSSGLNTNANDLMNTTSQVNENSSDNSATSQELAAGMQETTATTESINNNIVDIFENAQNINSVAIDSEKSAAEIQTKLPLTIKPGGKAEVKIKLDTAALDYQGEVIEVLTVITDAPSKPILNLFITGNIK